MSAVAQLPELPRRVVLTLADLVRAAQLADAPLPLRVDAFASGQLADRLRGASPSPPDDVRRALGEPDHLGELGLLDDGDLVPEAALALRVLAGGSLTVRLDLVARRRGGVVPLRSWFGVGPGLVAQLSTSSGRDLELAWFAPELWTSQLVRTLAFSRPAPSGSGLPESVSMPSEDLVAGCAAVRAGRTDVLGAWSPRHAAAVTALEATCRGRLRVLVRGRGRAAVTSWVLHDDGWRELRPGPAATVRLRRRDPRVIASWLAPAVARAAAGGPR